MALLPSAGPNPQINTAGNSNINPANSPGNTNTPGTAFSNTTGAIVNSGNVAYTGSPNSPAALAGKGIQQAPTVNANTHKMTGGRRRRNMKSRRRIGSKRQRRYYGGSRHKSHKHTGRHCKHYSHRKSRKHSGSRKLRGGYQQYLGDRAFSLGYATPGMKLPANLSALANPAPFKPYDNCPGGK